MTDDHEPAGEVVDTTEGSRDPLSTDDGLIAATAAMPVVADGRDVAAGEDTGRIGDDTGLVIAEDGSDPLTDAEED